MTAASLGNLNNRMRLRCHTCGWRAPDDTTMEAVELHFQVDHDTSDIKLDLVAVCRCGEAMTYGNSHTHGRDITDFFRCGVCGSTGYVTRKADQDG